MNQLEATREALGLTQGAMAEALGIGLRTYQEQESAEQPKLAYVLAARSLLPPSPEELMAARTTANRLLAEVAISYAVALGNAVGVKFDLEGDASRLEGRPLDSVPPAEARVTRLAQQLAADSLRKLQA